MMTPSILIRDETQDDAAVITEVTAAASESMAISHHTEPFIIQALRSAGALTVSRVADVEGRVVGHLAVSPVAMSDGTPHGYRLGPISVRPSYQRRGVGKAPIQEGLSRLKALGANGCCLVGHPHDYRPLGFEKVAGRVHPGVPPEGFLALSVEGRFPRGQVTFHEGFNAKSSPAPAGNTTAPHP